jgi:chemotaxis signal transduction protein
MSEPLSELARALRREFDAGFASPAERPRAEQEELLAIRAGGAAMALRARQIVRLAAELPIVPMPSPVEGFIGLTGLRGEVVPVYDLATLLGRRAPTEPRWLAVCGERMRAALAFEAFEGHLRVGLGAVSSPPEASPLTDQLVRLGDGDRPIVDLSAVLALIARRCGVEPPSKES